MIGAVGAAEAAGVTAWLAVGLVIVALLLVPLAHLALAIATVLDVPLLTRSAAGELYREWSLMGAEATRPILGPFVGPLCWWAMPIGAAVLLYSLTKGVPASVVPWWKGLRERIGAHSSSGEE